MLGVSKIPLQWYSKCHCVASITKAFILNGVQTIHRSTSGYDWRSVGQSVSMCWCRAPSGSHDQISLTIVKFILWPTFSRPVCPGVRPQSGPVTNFSFPFNFSLDSRVFVILWRPLWQEDGSAIYCCFLASPEQSLSSLSPAGLQAIFYCPNFCDSPNLEGQIPVFISLRNKVAQLYPRALGSLFVASYDSQGYGAGLIRLRTFSSK
jgi:hypothetical protein